MTNMVIAAAVLERLNYLMNDHDSQVIVKVNHDLVFVREQLKQIMDTAANNNITDDQANSFIEIMTLCCDLENRIESCLTKNFERSRQHIKDIERVCKDLADKISSQFTSMLRWTPPRHQSLQTFEVAAVETEEEDEIEEVEVEIEEEVETEERIVREVEIESEEEVETEETIVKKEEAEGLLSALTDGTPRLDLVSIYGTDAIGNTTLARKLFQDIKIAGHFQIRAWVCVSPQFEKKRVLKEILAATSDTCLTRRGVIYNMRELELVELIYQSLEGRRYLIVLDDVWSDAAWLSLRLAFPDDNNGSRLLITTRIKAVAEQGYGYIRQSRLLSDRASRKLFRGKLHLKETQINARPELMLILRLCGGLPLGVVLMASLLSKIPLYAWKELANQLNSSCSDSTGVAVEEHIVGLSYKYLPLHLRPCLLYLGTFPKDTAIECDIVCQLWIAEGLISMENIRTEETMMDVAERYLDELANRSLVIITEDHSRQRRFKSCKIFHDFINEFCQIKGREDKFFEVLHLAIRNRNMSSSIRQAIHLGNPEYTHSHLYENADYLRSLLFFTSNQSEEETIKPHQIPNLDNFIWLRVLYIYGVDFTDGKLPKEVEKLVYLRYLSFGECYLEELPSLVGKMSYLQTLDLRVRNECEMSIADVFNSFKRLKYLYFPLAYRAFNHEKLNLGELKELEILDNFDTSVCYVEDLHGLTKLKELKLTIEGDVLDSETILNTLENNMSRFRSMSLNIRSFNCHSRRRFSVIEKVFDSSVLHVLKVEGYLGKLPDFDLTSSNLTEIILNGSELVEDPMQTLQHLPNLTILVLETEAYDEEKMNCSSCGFFSLRFLKLFKLYKLKSWEVEKGAMPSLRTLVIENCKNLQMLPDKLEYCKELRELEIASMPDAFVGRIQKSDGTEGQDFYKIKHVQPNVKIDGQHLILKERQQVGDQTHHSEEIEVGVKKQYPEETKEFTTLEVGNQTHLYNVQGDKTVTGIDISAKSYDEDEVEVAHTGEPAGDKSTVKFTVKPTVETRSRRALISESSEKKESLPPPPPVKATPSRSSAKVPSFVDTISRGEFEHLEACFMELSNNVDEITQEAFKKIDNLQGMVMKMLESQNIILANQITMQADILRMKGSSTDPHAPNTIVVDKVGDDMANGEQVGDNDDQH